jgi:hypothetical protein
MKDKSQGAIEISVGDTEEEEKDVRFLTSTHGCICGEIRRTLLASEKLTKEQGTAEALQSIQDEFNALKG